MPSRSSSRKPSKAKSRESSMDVSGEKKTRRRSLEVEKKEEVADKNKKNAEPMKFIVSKKMPT